VGLQSAIAAAYQSGRARWPGIQLGEDELSAWITAGEVTAEQLDRHGSDLFLAAACSTGEPAAVAALEREFIRKVPVYVARFKLSPDLLDELKQQVRLKLLTGDRPRIRDYRGHGPLLAWLRMCTIRLALNLPELRRAAVPADEREWELLTGLDPDLDKLLDRQRHDGTLKEALEKALLSLERREKTILRMHIVDGMTIEDLGMVFHVHRATAARWLVAIRSKIFSGFQQQLHVRLGTGSEVKSLVRLLGGEIRLSIHRILQSAP
jgi:RNA polymerase sigma-70 factor (ECF subfamily)